MTELDAALQDLKDATLDALEPVIQWLLRPGHIELVLALAALYIVIVGAFGGLHADG